MTQPTLIEQIRTATTIPIEQKDCFTTWLSEGPTDEQKEEIRNALLTELAYEEECVTITTQSVAAELAESGQYANALHDELTPISVGSEIPTDGIEPQYVFTSPPQQPAPSSHQLNVDHGPPPPPPGFDPDDVEQAAQPRRIRRLTIAVLATAATITSKLSTVVNNFASRLECRLALLRHGYDAEDLRILKLVGDYRFGSILDHTRNEGVTLPRHPQSEFDEEIFINGLRGSISLSGDEKFRIIAAIPKLSQFQVDELQNILDAERKKFSRLSPKHLLQLQRLEQKFAIEWEQIVDSFRYESSLQRTA